MPASKPEECETFFFEAMNRGDLEAAVALHEPNAVTVQKPGEVITGLAATRELLRGFLALKPRFTFEVSAVHSGDGSLALTRAKWSLVGTDSDGKPVAMFGKNTELVRRQPDGAWLFVIVRPEAD